MLGRNINLEEVDEKVLYHYTKSNGINGIMNNKCFWATKNDFLIDPNEFSYVNKILREVCSDYIPDQKKLEMFLSDINDNGSGAEYFVLSFSCCRDSITMWAEFGNANGYNIGFDTHTVQRFGLRIGYCAPYSAPDDYCSFRVAEFGRSAQRPYHIGHAVSLIKRDKLFSCISDGLNRYGDGSLIRIEIRYGKRYPLAFFVYPYNDKLTGLHLFSYERSFKG